MRRRRGQDRAGAFSGNRVERAIIDIGSNTVRMVVYGGAPRAPVTAFNEKVAAQLGREIAQTGRLADEAVELAMRGLRRFALLLREWDIRQVDVVATAATRDASNGPEFLEQVRALGFEPRLLSGEDEARISAMGVIGAFPGSSGTVADLGGGSLELIGIADDQPGTGISLPLGTLRLPDYRAAGERSMRDVLCDTLIAAQVENHASGDTLFLVGGTWRAMAVVAMGARNYPLSDPHGLSISVREARAMLVQLSRQSVEQLSSDPRITPMRAAYLHDAGHLLEALLDRLAPQRLVFSSWGLREGLMFDELADFAQGQDPLLAGVGDFAASRGTPPMLATQVAAWTVGALGEASLGSERLRLSATMLALASMQIEPNLRSEIAVDWALHKRWIAVDAAGRAMMAAAVAANRDLCDLPASLSTLASAEQLEEAIRWGLAIRLCRRLGGRSNRLFNVSSLAIEGGVKGGALILSIEREFADLFGQPNEKDLALLAERMGLKPELRIVDPA